MLAHCPLMAIAKSAGPASIQIRSLKNDQQLIKSIQLPGVGLQSEPVWLESNSSVLVCATHTCIVGYDLTKLDEKFVISNCYSSAPFSLSTRWLAFADYRLYVIHQSAGGINASISDQNLSYTGAVLNVAKSWSKSVAKISESVLGYGYGGSSSTSGTSNDKPLANPAMNSSSSSTAGAPVSNNGHGNPPRHRHGSGKDEAQAGIVTVVDTVKLFGVRRECQSDEPSFFSP